MKKTIQILALFLALVMPAISRAQVIHLSDYLLSVSNTTFTSIATTGTRCYHAYTYRSQGVFTMPFAFPFGNNSCPTNAYCAISTSGYIYLNRQTAAALSATTTGNLMVINPILNELGDIDSNHFSGAGLYYQLMTDDNGDSVMVIEVNSMSCHDTTDARFTYQVWLHQDGDIDIIFDTVYMGGIGRTLRCFLRDGSHSDNCALYGDWRYPFTSLDADPMPTYDLPSHGTCYHFERPLVTCTKPYNLRARDITSNSATIRWSQPASSSASQWMLEYADHRIGAGQGTQILVDTNYYELSNLTPNTKYFLYLYAICDTDVHSPYIMADFQTACVPLNHEDLPISYGFEDVSGAGGSINSCFYKGTNQRGVANPVVVNTTSHSGTYSLEMYASQYWVTWVAFPTYTDSINELQLRFYAKKKLPTYSGNIRIGVLDTVDNIYTYSHIASVVAPSTEEWTEFEIDLDSYHGQGQFICIYLSTESYNNYVYVDDITLRPIPTCNRPDDFRLAGVTASSAAFSWTDTIANAWEIAYGPRGFDPDTAENSSNPNCVLYSGIFNTDFEFANLTTDFNYDFYVRAVCDIANSDWRGPIHVKPGSYFMPIDGTTTVSTCGITLYDNGGAYADYANNCNSTVTLIPTNVDSLLTISGTFTGNGNNDILTIYDGDVMSEATLLGTYYGSTPQNIGPFTSSYGPFTFHFESNAANTAPGFAIQAECVAPPECPSVAGLEVSFVHPRSAFATWRLRNENYGAPMGYNVQVTNLDNHTTVSYDTVNPYMVIGALQPSTHYRLKVRTICDGNVYSTFDSIDFTTFCMIGGDIEISNASTGTAAVQNYTIPVNNNNRYSISEQIILASELQGADTLLGISFEFATLSNMSGKTNCRIYLGHTSATDASTWNSDRSGFQEVYHGALNCRPGWNAFNFDTPFYYNGNDNLVICVIDSSNSHDGSTYKFKCHSTAGTMARGNYNDRGFSVSNPTPSMAPTYNYRYNVRLRYPCNNSELCAAPNVVVVESSGDEVTLNWAPGNGEDLWWVSHKQADSTNWITDVTSTGDNSYTIGNLQPGVAYTFRVSCLCNGDTLHGICNFTTTCIPMTLPFSEDFESWTESNVATVELPVCWNSFGTPSVASYQGTKAINMNSNSNIHSTLVLPAVPELIQNLQVSFQLNASYSANNNIIVGVMTDPEDESTFTAVRTVALTNANSWNNNYEVPFSYYTGEGEYIALRHNGMNSCYLDNLQVDYIPTCPRPSNVVVSNVTSSTAEVAWVDSLAGSYVIEYGPYGFSLGTGTQVTCSTEYVMLQNLSHSTTYQVYVMGFCSVTDSSVFSFPVSFQTECGPLAILPYTDDFEGLVYNNIVHAPRCWTSGSTYSTMYPFISSQQNFTANGNSSLHFYSDADHETYAMLPEVDTTAIQINQTELRFFARGASSQARYALEVGLSEAANIVSFVPLDTIYVTGEGWHEYEVFFDSHVGDANYPTIRSLGNCDLYIDSVSYQYISPCARPDHLRTSNIGTSSVTLNWNNHGTATQWQIEYGPVGFQEGMGTQILANSNPFTLSNLPASYQGEFTVRAICGSGSYSDWALVRSAFNLDQTPATLPYDYTFENGSEFSNWQHANNSTYRWARGAAGSSTLSPSSMGMFVTSNGTTATHTDGIYNVATYRDINFGNDPEATYVLSFDALVGGSELDFFDGLMVMLVDPNAPVVISNAYSISPWGNTDNLNVIQIVRPDSLNNNGWTNFNVSLDGVQGIQRLAFFWFCYPNTQFAGEMPKVDNISIAYASCSRPRSIHLTQVDATTATLAWAGEAAAQYEVSYTQAGTTTPLVRYCNSNSIMLAGLQALTSYTVSIRMVCGQDTSYASSPFTFQTTLCDGSIYDTIGHDSYTDYSMPVNNYRNYSLTQTIVEASELESGMSNISAIAYQYASNYATTQKNNVTIYLSHTSLSEFANDSAIVPVDNSFVQVYQGSLNCQQGWNLFQFDTVFHWNGQQNILITVDDNSQASDGSLQNFYHSYTTSNKSIAYSSNTLNPDPANPGVFSGTRTANMSRANMILISCGAERCNAPVVTSTNVTATTATITWNGDGNNYLIESKPASQATWNENATTVQGYTYTYSDLLPATTYDYRLRQECDVDNHSEWVTGQFTTDSLPCFVPTNLAASNITGTSALLTWTPGGEENAWMLHIWNNTYNDSILVRTTSATLNNLVSGTEYQAEVKSVCGEMAGSSWSASIRFSTLICDPVSNVQVTDITSRSAKISWTNNGSANQWEIEYGMAGFGQGEGTIVVATSNPFTLSGLDSELPYDVYVRSVCGDNWVSSWTSKVSFTTTAAQGIDNIETGMSMAIYPNPTSGSTTISLSGLEGEVIITLVDMNGRKVMTEKVACDSADCVKSLNVDHLAQGAYFVRIQHNEQNIVKKLVVK